MSLIRRITTSITSSVDRAVSKVENHDAIIDAALRETRQAAARSRVRLERVRRDGDGLRNRHRELQTAIGRWTERARSIGEVSQQRNVMRSRQSVAEAMRTINNIEGVSYGDIEDTFDRWEINLGETEILMGASSPIDPLDSAFLAEEDAAELRAELHVLFHENEERPS